MEIILGGIDKFENIKSNAYWARAHLNTSFRPDDLSISDYEKHLKDCYEHPTTGFIAKRQFITKPEMDYPHHAKRNKHLIENNPEVKGLMSDIKDNVKKLYSKTKHVRQYIIDQDRVVLDCVKPLKKYTKADKLKIFLKRFI